MSAIMVQGTSSSAGKSFLVTALCRILARRGIRAAPFKAVNMSNNARVVNGLEMPTAQYFQAIAAGIEPDVRMAPILVKPEAGGSQVVVMGKVDRHLSTMAWQDRPVHQWPVVTSALRWVQDNYDVVVIEGAGSPAEVNLRALDVVNMAVAREANAAVLLVADIDRGGSFAHLYGTWALLNQDEQRLVRGYVLNKFRGDPRLLAGGPERLEQLTGVPTVAVVPWVAERLPEEDAFGWRNDSATTGFRVAVVAYPSISNLDEFRSLEETATVDLIRRPSDLGHHDLVILPGSKDVRADLDWIRSTGLDGALASESAKRTPMIGICGGLQILGQTVIFEEGDPSDGLGLIPSTVVYETEKLVTSTRVSFGGLDGPWRWLNGVTFDGYEIRRGRAAAAGSAALGPEVVQAGSVLGVSAHGLFEHPDVVARLTGHRPETVEAVIDRVADRVEASFSIPVERLLT